MKNHWNYRQILLAIALAGVAATLARLALDPNAGNRRVTRFEFPERVPLQGWRLVSSEPPEETLLENPSSIERTAAAWEYVYENGDRQRLEIQMHYRLGTVGDVKGYLRSRPAFAEDFQEISLDRHQLEGAGFHATFTHAGRSHLVSCINPRGSNTVSSARFLANRRDHDLRGRNLPGALLGQRPLRDRRCLFTDLSLPARDNSDEATTFSTLESAWFVWQEWWRQNFPPL